MSLKQVCSDLVLLQLLAKVTTSVLIEFVGQCT